MADDGIDPRYAAQFQRGFDPAVHPAPAPPQVAPPVPQFPVRLPGGPPASVPRVEDVRPARIVETTVDAAPVADSPADPAEPPPGSRLEWAPLAAGLGLIALAALVFWQSVTDIDMQGGVFDVSHYTFLQIRNTLPGPLVVAGVLALASWVVLRAVRRSR